MTRLSRFFSNIKAGQPSCSFEPNSFCFAPPLKKIYLSFAPTLFCFALPLKKILLPFAPTVFMSSFCSNRFYVSLFYGQNIYFPFVLNASFKVYTWFSIKVIIIIITILLFLCCVIYNWKNITNYQVNIYAFYNLQIYK